MFFQKIHLYFELNYNLKSYLDFKIGYVTNNWPNFRLTLQGYLHGYVTIQPIKTRDFCHMIK